MAAQRIGSILTNVTGTAGQLLRVNAGETGFEFVTPATIPAYTVTNKTVDRVIDADDVTLDEVADVLSTLIDDLAAAGLSSGSPIPFQWSTSEQVWPFEKAVDGSTLYCKLIDLGALPSGVGHTTTAHGIADPSKIHDVNFYITMTSSSRYYPLPFVAGVLSQQIQVFFLSTDIYIYVWQDWSSYNGYCKVIYAK